MDREALCERLDCFLVGNRTIESTKAWIKGIDIGSIRDPQLLVRLIHDEDFFGQTRELKARVVKVSKDTDNPYDLYRMWQTMLHKDDTEWQEEIERQFVRLFSAVTADNIPDWFVRQLQGFIFPDSIKGAFIQGATEIRSKLED